MQSQNIESYNAKIDADKKFEFPITNKLISKLTGHPKYNKKSEVIPYNFISVPVV